MKTWQLQFIVLISCIICIIDGARNKGTKGSPSRRGVRKSTYCDVFIEGVSCSTDSECGTAQECSTRRSDGYWIPLGDDETCDTRCRCYCLDVVLDDAILPESTLSADTLLDDTTDDDTTVDDVATEPLSTDDANNDTHDDDTKDDDTTDDYTTDDDTTDDIQNGKDDDDSPKKKNKKGKDDGEDDDEAPKKKNTKSQIKDDADDDNDTNDDDIHEDDTKSNDRKSKEWDVYTTDSVDNTDSEDDDIKELLAAELNVSRNDFAKAEHEVEMLMQSIWFLVVCIVVVNVAVVWVWCCFKRKETERKLGSHKYMMTDQDSDEEQVIDVESE